MHWDYLDAASPYVDGHVGWYASRVADVGRSDQLAREIDALSANSATETHTMSEQAAFAARVRQLGDIDLITRSIMSAVLFSLLFTTAWTMGQTLRERRSELATLRAIGFSTRRLALLLTAETILLFNAGCLLGLLVASAVIAVTGHVMGDVLTFATVTTADGFAAIGLALLLGCAVGTAASLRHLRGNISSVLVRH
ncbi:ABC transporter permease [Lysobacter pythonis]|uniref:ABC transporter permease n=1 Tax=Solilutibacter pythonis TaxID=2483112 RepID=A0A3M2HXI6_9GAMM|nr:ABC transporter permease [Lysobacter pythonis]